MPATLVVVPVAVVDVELFKGSIHLCLFGFAAMCLGYNTMAYTQRPSHRFAINAVVYAALSWFEITQIMRHVRTTP